MMKTISGGVLIVASSWWAAPARLALAFEHVDLQVSAVCPPGHPLLRIATIRKCYRYDCYRPLDALAAAIDDAAPDLVLPTDDRSFLHLLALYDRSNNHVQDVLQRSLGHPERLAVLCDRYPAIRLADGLGIRVPPTKHLQTLHDLDEWNQPFPWVLKSSGSWGGSGVRIAHDLAAARSAFAALSRPIDTARALKRWVVNRDGFWLVPWLSRHRPEVIVQRFIRGQPANIAAACWEGTVLSTLPAIALRTHGAVGAASVVRVVESPEMNQAARLIVQALGLSGLHGIDFVIDEDRNAWLIEINPRATQLCHFSHERGSSLVVHLAGRLRGVVDARDPPARPGTVVALFPQAWLGTARDPLLVNAVHDVPWEEPALIRELLGMPWPNRSLLARLWQKYVRPQALENWTGPSVAGEPARPGGKPEMADTNVAIRWH